LIPLVAISPILLYIGMLIGAQAFQETPKHHAPAIVLAVIPNIAAWGKLLIDGALGAAGTNAAAVGFDKLGQVGVLYHGLEVLGAGAILGGMVLGAIGAFIIDKKYTEASYFAAAGAVLTFFGFMHGEAVGIAVTPTVAVAYAVVAVFLFAEPQSGHRQHIEVVGRYAGGRAGGVIVPPVSAVSNRSRSVRDEGDAL
jgi:AGZA family xanthine/uracil permease-like MFS transporter